MSIDTKKLRQVAARIAATWVADATPPSALIEAAADELDAWRSVFPDIAPDQVLPRDLWPAPRPMAEAPRDGTWILAVKQVSDPERSSGFVPLRAPGLIEDYWLDDVNHSHRGTNFIGWFPLPSTAPVTAREGEQEVLNVLRDSPLPKPGTAREKSTS